MTRGFMDGYYKYPRRMGRPTWHIGHPDNVPLRLAVLYFVLPFAELRNHAMALMTGAQHNVMLVVMHMRSVVLCGATGFFMLTALLE